MEKETKEQAENLCLQADLSGNYLLDKNSRDLKQIGIFYAPSGGSVHKVAKIIKQKLSSYGAEMFCISDIKATELLNYQNLILVCSSLGRNTWEMEQKDKWSVFLPEMRNVCLNGRKVAIVGLGDHVTYPNNFVDGISFLADVVRETGGELVGETPTLDYIFNDSRALEKGMFIGLPLDEDFEPEKTEVRLNTWIEKLKEQFC